MAKATSNQNTNLKDLAPYATTGGSILLPRIMVPRAAAGLDYNVGHQGVATHADGDTFAASDAVALAAGVDKGGLLRKISVDAAGFQDVGMATHSYADQGGTWRAVNATFGTGIAYAIQTAFSSTAAFAIIRNTAGGGGVRLFPDYIRLILTVVPPSATQMQYALAVEGANRYTSGGTTLAAGNVNTASAQAASASVIVGAPAIAAAGGTVRYIARGVARSAIPVVNDEYLWSFGEADAAGSNTGFGGTTAQRIAIPCPPVVLGPGANHSMLLHLWFPGNITTAPSFECEVGWWER